MLRFQCAYCKKLTAGRMPRAPKGDNNAGMPGDGTERYPRRHKHKGAPCPGNIELALWVNTEKKVA